jgi:transposase
LKKQDHIELLQELEKLEFIIVFADECGIQEDLNRDYGRIQDDQGNLTKVGKPKSRRLMGLKTATKHNKTGVISGYARLPDKDKYQYVYPMKFYDTCNTNTFNAWLEQNFVPDVVKLQKLYPNNYITLVLDNVTYHKTSKTKDICDKYGIILIYQPPYSPDLNPIEPSWDNLKNGIRDQSYQPITFDEKLDNPINRITWECC